METYALASPQFFALPNRYILMKYFFALYFKIALVIEFEKFQKLSKTSWRLQKFFHKLYKVSKLFTSYTEYRKYVKDLQKLQDASTILVEALKSFIKLYKKFQKSLSTFSATFYKTKNVCWVSYPNLFFQDSVSYFSVFINIKKIYKQFGWCVLKFQ